MYWVCGCTCACVKRDREKERDLWKWCIFSNRFLHSLPFIWETQTRCQKKTYCHQACRYGYTRHLAWLAEHPPLTSLYTYTPCGGTDLSSVSVEREYACAWASNAGGKTWDREVVHFISVRLLLWQLIERWPLKQTSNIVKLGVIKWSRILTGLLFNLIN